MSFGQIVVRVLTANGFSTSVLESSIESALKGLFTAK